MFLRKAFRSAARELWCRLPSAKGLIYNGQGNVYLFVPINGAGLGHLTRCLAIASRLRKYEPAAKIIFFTTSIGVSLVSRAGFVCYHIPPYALLNSHITIQQWNRLFYDNLMNVLSLHRPRTLVFDGSAPYLALRRIIYSIPSMKFIWIKRGLYKEEVDTKKINSFIRLFNLVITPAELVDDQPYPLGSTLRKVAPVRLLDKDQLLAKNSVIKALHLPQASRCAYVQLGAGNINGISDLQKQIVDLLRENGVYVVVGKSPISLEVDHVENADGLIVDYPNSRYYSAFDFAVLAAGYNSVCEAVALGMPAIFIPNVQTGADDQYLRARQAEVFGPYVALGNFTKEDFSRSLEKLFALINAKNKNCFSLPNGADEAALLIKDNG